MDFEIHNFVQKKWYTGPSDIYYCCLDGTYNSDSDEYWGEPTDGEDGGEVDFYAEVYIGRACVDDNNQVDNFVTKTISYLDSDDYYLKKVLLVGEWYAHTGLFQYFGKALDDLVDESSNYNYFTKGFPSDKFNISKFSGTLFLI